MEVASLGLDGTPAVIDAGAVDVAVLFDLEAASLTRLARFYVDDKTAAEDLVQEAFIRFARSSGRIRDRSKAAAYLRWAAVAVQQGMRHTSGTEPSLELALTGRMLPEIEMDLLRHLDAITVPDRMTGARA